jgi:pilus assembly protein Flp/PilA
MTNKQEENNMKDWDLHVLELFLCEESGQDLIEYALIAALIALAAVGAMQSVGSSVANVFNSVGGDI